MTQVVPTVPASATPQPPPVASQTAAGANTPPAYTGAVGGASAPPPNQGRGAGPYLIGGGIVLGVLLLGLVGFLAVRALSGAGGANEAGATPTAQVTITATATATASPPPPPATPTPTVNPTDIPTDSKDCGGGVRAIGPTSCQFALQVRDQYYYSGSPALLRDVYSPITGETYDMRCTPEAYPVRCTGGNNAEVLIF